MFENLYNKLKEGNDQKVVDNTSKKQDESLLDSMSSYLISKYAYTLEGVKVILRGAINGKFNINIAADRSVMINTLYDVINLETVNKYNNKLLELTEGLRNPIAVTTDLSHIVLNTDPELSVFIHDEERRCINNFNEEADYVRSNFSK